MNPQSLPHSAHTFSFLKSFTKGEFSYGFWNVVSKAVAFFNTVLIISQLTIYQYGVFQLLLSSYAALSIFIGLGDDTVRNDVFRYIGEKKFGYAKKLLYQSFALRFSIGLFSFLGVFFGAPLFSARFGPEFIALMQIFSLLFLHDALLTTVRLFLESDRRFSLIASRASFTKFGQGAILLYFFLFAHIGLIEVVLSLVVAQFFAFLFLVPSFMRSMGSWRKVEAVREGLIAKILLTYGKWEMIIPPVSRATNFFQNWLIKFFVGTEAVAIISVAQSMLGVFSSFFPIKTLSTLIPMRIGNDAQLQKIYTFSTKYLCFLAVLIACGSLIVAPVAVYVFFPKYIISLPYFYLLLIALPISAISSITSILLVVFRQQRALFLQKILKAVLGIFMIPFLIFFGLWGIIIYRPLFGAILSFVAYYQLRLAKPNLYIDLRMFFTFTDEDRAFVRDIFGHLKGFSIKRLKSLFT